MIFVDIYEGHHQSLLYIYSTIDKSESKVFRMGRKSACEFKQETDRV
jgi:hypothetical protein